MLLTTTALAADYTNLYIPALISSKRLTELYILFGQAASQVYRDEGLGLDMGAGLVRSTLQLNPPIPSDSLYP